MQEDLGQFTEVLATFREAQRLYKVVETHVDCDAREVKQNSMILLHAPSTHAVQGTIAIGMCDCNPLAQLEAFFNPPTSMPRANGAIAKFCSRHD